MERIQRMIAEHKNVPYQHETNGTVYNTNTYTNMLPLYMFDVLLQVYIDNLTTVDFDVYLLPCVAEYKQLITKHNTLVCLYRDILGTHQYNGDTIAEVLHNRVDNAVDVLNSAIDDYNNATQALNNVTLYRDVLTLDNVDTNELHIDTDDCDNIETHSLHQYVRDIERNTETVAEYTTEYNAMLRVIDTLQSNIDFVRKYVPLLIDNINRITYIITNAYDDSERRDVLQQQQTLKNAFVDDYMYTHGIYTIDNALQHCQSWYNETHEQIKGNGNK